MDRSWMYGKRNSTEFQKGVEEFCRNALKYATITNDEGFYCPCVDCSNVTKVDSIKVLREHIFCRGFRQDYHIWIWHGEEGVYRRNSNINYHISEQLVENDNPVETEHHLQNEVEPNPEIDEYDLNESNGVDIDEENNDDDDDDCEEDDDQLKEMLDGVEDHHRTRSGFDSLTEACELPLYHGCKKYTKLSGVLTLQWLNVLVGTMVDEDAYNIYLDADLFYYNDDGKTEVYKDDLRQFLEGKQPNIPIIQIFIRALQDDLMKAATQLRLGWLCPDATSDVKLIKKTEIAIAYITRAFQLSVQNGHQFILAPIIDSKHWVLLAICPQTYTIYEFDSLALKEGRKLYMKMVVLSSLRRYKMSGGDIKVKRKEPLWKSIKCPQRDESLESGYFVMRFMYDIVKSCTTITDLENVFNSRGEESYIDCEISEMRDRWAMYFTSRCVN